MPVDRKCCVRDCNSTNRSNDCKIFGMPLNPGFRKKWIEILQLSPDIANKRLLYVCSAHFEEGQYGRKVRKGVVPTRNLGKVRRCVRGCKEGLVLHKFPSEAEMVRRLEWMRRLGVDVNIKTKMLFACEKHFSTMYRNVRKLTNGAVPDRNLCAPIHRRNAQTVQRVMLRCIRFGEVLLDETFRTFLICNQCQTEFVEVAEFRVHLATSACGGRLFKDDVVAMKFGAAQVTRAGKEKTYLLYNPADVQTANADTASGSANAVTASAVGGDDEYLDLMKIEEELLDPRWYTDIANVQSDVDSPRQNTALKAANNKALEYKELVEAVGPYVQFKGNDKTNATKGNQKIVAIKTNKINNANGAAATASAVNACASAESKSLQQPPKCADSNAVKSEKRVLNPAARRKLDLTPKQVHFEDKVSIKYLINDQLCANVTTDKPTISIGGENKSKTLPIEDGPAAKRRKTIGIPMEHARIQPALQEQFGRRSSDVAQKSSGGISVANTTTTVTSRNTAPIANSNAAGSIKIKAMALEDNFRTTSQTSTTTTTAAPVKSVAQENSRILVRNPLVKQISQQINGTKKQTIVQNAISNTKIKANVFKKADYNLDNPLINKSDAATALARPQQRIINTVVKQPITATTQLPTQAKPPAPPALAPLSSNKVSNPAALVASAKVQQLQQQKQQQPKDAQQQTNDLLSKLQTRGLQVKRTQPITTNATQQCNTTSQPQNKTMELLQKLQSKGMKVKILNGSIGGGSSAGANRAPAVSSKTSITLKSRTIKNAAQTKTILNNDFSIRK